MLPFIFVSGVHQATTENPVNMKKLNTRFILPSKNRALFPFIMALSFFLYPYPSGILQGQPDAEEKSIFDYLSKEGAIIQLVLETDLNELINNRMRGDYQPAQLFFVEEGDSIQLEVDVIPRGNYRRRICDFPPILLNFSKNYLAGRGLNKEYDKMKLVSHCQKEQGAQDQLLKEFLAYKLYNVASHASYRVQLARITYKDSKGKQKNIEQYGILIEDTDEMAHRIGGLECDCRNYPADSIATAEENTMAVFQYMIGNEDWSLQMLRNVKLIRPYNGGRIIPVPYDFDFSGFVNASYAVPRSQLGITDIRQRIFLGNPASEERLTETLKAFDRQREQFRATVQNFEALSGFERKSALKYLDGFFKKKQQSKLVAEVAEKRAALKENAAVSNY